MALVLAEHPGHGRARDWAGGLERRRKALLFCRATEQSFARLLTTARVLNALGIAAMTNDEAAEALRGILENPLAATAPEPAGTGALWLKLAARPSASPKLWMDAYLAAFAIRGDSIFSTFDRGFRQFESAGLRLELLGRA